MKHTFMKGLAAAAVVTVALGACSSSGSPSSSSSGGSSSGSSSNAKPLVIDDTPLSPMTRHVQPVPVHLDRLRGEGGGALQRAAVSSSTRSTRSQTPFTDAGHRLQLVQRRQDADPPHPARRASGTTASRSAPRDVAFTFNMIKHNPGLTTDGTPVPASATAPAATTAVLKFSQPEYANLFLIGQVSSCPQHIWSTVNPATFTDPNPVGTGPFMLDKFTPAGLHAEAEPALLEQGRGEVPEISFPVLQQPTSTSCTRSPRPDRLGRQLRRQTCRTSTWPRARQPHLVRQGPVLDRQQRGVAVLQHHQGAAERPGRAQGDQLRHQPPAAVRAGRDRLRAAGTSTSGLLLPSANSYLEPSLANNLPSGGDPAKVATILTADGYTKVNGKWTKNGTEISFSISDPIPYTDYYTDAQLIAQPAQRAGLQRHGRRHRQPDRVGRPTSPTAPSTPRSTGATRARPRTTSTTAGWTARSRAPIGKPAAGDIGRFKDPATQSALTSSRAPTTRPPRRQRSASSRRSWTTQVPVAPLLYGAAWCEFSTRNYTGWPTSGNPYMTPTPNSPVPGDRPAPEAGVLTDGKDEPCRRSVRPPGRATGRAVPPRGHDQARPPMTADAPNTDAHARRPAPTQPERRPSPRCRCQDKVLPADRRGQLAHPGADALGPAPDDHVGRAGRGPRRHQGRAQPSSSLPCPSAMGATWDTELIAELAAALGAEARGKGVDVLLAPDHQPDAHAAGRPRASSASPRTRC